MRVERYFAFVDLRGFTAYTESQGDPAPVAVLTRFRAAVCEAATNHGVRVAKWLGDGAMIVSVQAEALVDAVLDLQQVPLELTIRAGIAGGDVLLIDGEDYIGHAVNLASRLSDDAEGDEVVAPADLVAQMPASVAVSTRSSRTLPGIGQAVPVVSLKRD